MNSVLERELSMGQIEHKKRRYITGFDGLRAIAVIGVIVFHLWPNHLIGGWLGVPLFFVLSGYLITDLLIQEFELTQRIDFMRFYRRRIKRLYPALVMMLLATATVIGLFARDLLYNLRAIITTNLTYVYNLWATKHGDSYFDAWGGASPFTHLWSLSIEGQFYLIWPLVVLGLLLLRIRRYKIALGLVGLAGLSAILMGVLYDPTNINRVYYGTDTRLFAILMGTALAFVWPSNRMKLTLRPAATRNLNVFGGLALALTLFGFFWLNGQWATTYHGLMFVFTIIITGLIAITAHPGSFLSRVLDNKVLNYLGQRSYSIYLYQLPVFVFFDRAFPDNQGWLLNIIKLIVVLLLSEVSYRYVENLFRRMASPSLLGRGELFRQTWQLKRNQLTLGVGALLLLGTGYALSAHAAGQAKPQTTLQKRLTANKDKIKAANDKALQPKKAAGKHAKPVETVPLNPDVMAKYNLDKATYAKIKDQEVTAIGDSVMVDVAPDLQEMMPHTVADAEVGRQAYSMPGILQTYIANKQLADNVVISIGTNGIIGENDFKKMMKIMGDRQVYWVNAYADRSWVETNNNFLVTQVKKYPNLHLVDWNSIVQGHGEWLGPDQVHPNPDGSIQYARLIAEVMAAHQK